MDKSKFGTFIKEKRLEQKLTQKELADKLMIDVTAVSKWERGVNYPDITMIPDICTCLRINEHELIESSNDTEYRAIKADAQKYRKIKNTVFWSFSIAYALAVVICLIVNLAVDHTLSWSLTVTAACICGFTFIPTCTRFFKKYKLGVFVLSTFLSLFILFAVCCISSGSNWLWVAAAAVLEGYFMLFYPILFRHQERYLGEEKYASVKKYFAISCVAGIVILTLLLLLCIAAYTDFYLSLALKVLAYCSVIFIIYGIVALTKANMLIKLGADSVFTALHLYGMNGIFNYLFEGTAKGCYAIDFSDWSNADGNVALIGLVFFLALGLALLILGLRKRKLD